MRSAYLFKLMRSWLLEFLQNFPLACAFLYGFALFSEGRPTAGAAAVIGGTLAGVVLIRITEPLITKGPVEHLSVSCANLFLFSAAISITIPYFYWPAGSWLTDIFLGAAIGGLVSIVQSRAARAAGTRAHTAALTAAFPAAFLVLRFWALTAPPLTAALALSAVVTTIITAIEYAR